MKKIIAVLAVAVGLFIPSQAQAYLHQDNAYRVCSAATSWSADAVLYSYRGIHASPIGPAIYDWQRYSSSYVWIKLQYHEWQVHPAIAVNYACYIQGSDASATITTIWQGNPYWVS